MRVVKVGGSLFDLPDLSDRLQTWLTDNGDQQNLLVAGGGKFVDHVRHMQRVHQFDDLSAHWISIETLSATALLLSSLLPGALLTDELDEARQSKNRVIVFQTHDWLRSVNHPQSWDITSDSIAAYLAVAIKANELVLLKSVDFISGSEDFVDGGFQAIAGEIPRIGYVNLRR